MRLMQCLLAIFKVEASTRSSLAVLLGSEQTHCISVRRRGPIAHGRGIAQWSSQAVPRPSQVRHGTA